MFLAVSNSPLSSSSPVDGCPSVSTETEYYYLKALNLVDSDAYDETINEPIKYPSNVHGGTGMVGISTEVSKKVRIRTWQR